MPVYVAKYDERLACIDNYMMLFFKDLMVNMTGGAVGKTFLRALLIAITVLAFAPAAPAAGLGKLTVLSNLGQPLRAEIDVVAVEKGELETLGAKLATVDSYLQNNLPYPAPSLGLRLSLEKRASGDPYIQVTTTQPVNEPFVDVLVELTWSGGRILRAYTALLDPPAYGAEEPAAAARAPESPGEVRPAPEAAAEPEVETQLGSEFAPKAEEAPAPAEVAPLLPAEETPGVPMPQEATEPPAEITAKPAVESPTPAAEPSAPAPIKAETETPGKYTVSRGETLSHIANEQRPDDITLEQMLVALFRSNPDAFAGNNMNRLKAGKVLRIPDAGEAAAMDARQARREVRLQTADWNAYRTQLAGAVGMAPLGAEAGQAASGAVSSMVEDQAMPAPGQPQEVLKLSKGEAPAAAAAGAAAAQQRIRSLEEELAARQKTLGEQTDRVAKLEKTVKDMQVLLEMKNKTLAELQSKAGSASEPPALAPSTSQPSLPTPGDVQTPPALPSAAPEDTASAAASPAEPAPGSETAPTASAGQPTATAAKPRSRIVVEPEPEPEASLLDRILGQPLYLAGAAAVLGLLGFLGYRMARNRRAAAFEIDDEVAEKKTSDVTPAASADTGAATLGAVRVAQPAPVTEEVDPLAEAEIYLAYGRDSQAEDILKEALQNHPRRHEIHVKLLEIYAKRKDVQAFEPVARALHAATGGQGDTWLHVARLGFQLDPQNARYAGGKPSGAEAAVVAAASAAAAPLEERLDFNIGLDDADIGTKTDIDLTRLGSPMGGTTTDIDLSNLGAPTEPGQFDLSTIAGVPGDAVQSVDLDLELPPPAPAAGDAGLNFDFDLSALSAPAAENAATATVTRAMTQTIADVGEPGMGTIEFDLSKISLDTGGIGRNEPRIDVSGAAPSMPEIDLSAISLDLGGEPEVGAGAAKDDRWYDVQTKFDLAKAYQEMGDKEGAREILREVIAEGDSEQKAAAERVLETLS
jgi:pilus assembly protein FimV